MRIILFWTIFVLFIFGAAVSEAAACRCSASQTVLDEFIRSPIVVSARLDSFDELDRSIAGTNVYRTMAAVMTVDKVYKGTLKTGQVIRLLNGGGGDCTTVFLREKIGQRFLFYTGPATRIGGLKGVLHLIGKCSRSARIEEAGPDLTYLDDRAKLTGKTRLSGLIKRFGPNPPSLANIKVAVSGRNFERDVVTDARGFFELWDLPAGQYQVAFTVPNGTKIGAYMFTPADRTWRRESPPNNTIPVTIGAKKHLELTVGLAN
jgi:hypothetical protein